MERGGVGEGGVRASGCMPSALGEGEGVGRGGKEGGTHKSAQRKERMESTAVQWDGSHGYHGIAPRTTSSVSSFFSFVPPPSPWPPHDDTRSRHH